VLFLDFCVENDIDVGRSISKCNYSIKMVNGFTSQTRIARRFSRLLIRLHARSERSAASSLILGAEYLRP
jgi:hypothetical protein